MRVLKTKRRWSGVNSSSRRRRRRFCPWRFAARRGQRIPDRAAYANRALYPAEVARVADTAWLRDQHLARLEIYPFQYRAAAQELTWHRRLLIEVKFEGAALSGGAGRRGPG